MANTVSSKSLAHGAVGPNSSKSQADNNQYSTITNSRVGLCITVEMGARVGISIGMHQ